MENVKGMMQTTEEKKVSCKAAEGFAGELGSLASATKLLCHTRKKGFRR